MDELFTIIGKLYFDLVRSQNIIESLKQQLKESQQSNNVDN